MTYDSRQKNIPVVIPSLEPNENLLRLLKSLREVVSAPIIIVNDGSPSSYDPFYEEAEKKFDCILLKHEVNMGKGRALKDAFDYCLNEWPDLTGVVTADSDGQHLVHDIEQCRNLLAQNPKDLILGCRDFSGKEIPWKSRFGNRLTQKVCKWFCGVNVKDTQTGLRGIPAFFMKELLTVQEDRFEFETRMLIETKNHVQIREFSIETVYESKTQHVTHFNPVKDSIRVYGIFLKMFLTFVVSSLSSSVIDLVLFSAFCGVFRDAFPIVYVTIATVLARVISAVYNYTINYRFVFKSKAGIRQSAVRYFLLAVVQMLASAGLTTSGVYLFSHAPEVVVKIVVDVVLFMISFIIQREIVYKKQEN